MAVRSLPALLTLNANRRSTHRFTLIELLVVVAIIGILAAMLLPVLATARAKAQSKQCMGNLKQLGMGMALYAQESDDSYPAARWKTGVQTRWHMALGDYIGGSVATVGVESHIGTGNRIVNDVLRCPSIALSTNQISGNERGDFLRSGAYGLNWAAFGPFDNTALPRPFPVREGQITASSSTIMIADAYGDAAQTESVHAYTLDGPTQLNGRWGTNSSQCPADPRHLRRFEAVFADGHAEELTMAGAGYDSEFPEDVGGTGNPLLWNGFGDASMTSY